MVCAFQVLIPAVYREAVVEGKAHGYDDAPVLEKSVQARRVQVMHSGDEPAEAEHGLPMGGEREVYRLFRRESAAGSTRVYLVSDDQRLLRRLRLLGVRPITPGAVPVFLAREGLTSTREAMGCLEAMRRTISTSEYEVCRTALATLQRGEG